MSYPNHNNHGRSSRPNPPGVNSHSGSSYAEQGTITLPLLTVTFPTPFDPPVLNNYQNPYPTQSRSTPVPYQQPYYSSPQQQTQSTYPTSSYPLYNGHWEDIPQLAEGVVEQGMPQDTHLNASHRGMEGYHPLILGDPVAAAAPYAFRTVGFPQGIPPQGQANDLENREYDLLDYAPQHVAPSPAQAAFHPPFVNQAIRAPTPDQLREDNLRRLARRFLYHPDSRVNRVWTERGAGRAAEGRFKVVIFLEASDLL